MKILSLDRDSLAVQLLKSKLEPEGHTVFHEEEKDKAIELAGKEAFDLVIYDPSPLTSGEAVIKQIRRAVPHYTYILIASDQIDPDDALKHGANDVLYKPLDPSVILEKVENAKFLNRLVRRIGDDNEDFPSSGGVISKSAFNQLFLSCMYRADRYSEQSYILFISIENHKEIRDMDGKYAADYATAKLSHNLVKMHRQSDIIGQTAQNEFALLFMKTDTAQEPLEATDRFLETLSKSKDLLPEGCPAIDLSLTLINLPMGERVKKQAINVKKNA